jgi:hypothetical protein
MKSTIERYGAKGTLLATVVLATSLFAGVTHAQSNFRGRFTLPYEAHWGQAVLPPGNYLLELRVSSFRTVVVRNADTLRIVAFEPIQIREDSKRNDSALLISTRGGRRIVYSVVISELGTAFVYDPALAHPKLVKEAHRVQAVPVLAARN